MKQSSPLPGQIWAMDAGDLDSTNSFRFVPNTWNRICAREYPPSPDPKSGPRLFFWSVQTIMD